MKANSLAFQDMDDVDLLEDVEKAFGIRIEDAEAEQISNLGDLHDLIVKKSGATIVQKANCLSAMAFYRLRSVARTYGQTKILPSTLVGNVLLKKQHVDFSNQLQKMHGLNLTLYPNVFCLAVGALLLAASLLTYGLNFITGFEMFGGIVSGIVFLLASMFSQTFASDKTTFADLSRTVEHENIGKLGVLAGGLDQKLIWPWVVKNLNRSFGNVKPVNKDTVFFRESE